MADRNKQEIDHPELLCHWQSAKFKTDKNPENLHLKADMMRTMLAHLSFAEKISRDNSGILYEMERTLESYSDLLDVTEEGLNNYAEDILKLAEHKKLESDKWQSSLTFESVKKLEFVQEFITSVSKQDDPNISSELLNALKKGQNDGKVEKNASSPNLSHCSKRLKPCVESDIDIKKTLTNADTSTKNSLTNFCTAKEQLLAESIKKNKNINHALIKKSLGSRRNVGNSGNKFVSPLMNRNENGNSPLRMSDSDQQDDMGHLKNIEPKMIEMIENEIMDHGSVVTWDDIAGLEFAKRTIKESIVWPLLRPDLFKGLRSAPKGILLFGPPGTGKTMIGKCIASQAKAVFFCISASSLTSKWVGEGEKMVRALFAVARQRQPSVIFIDEIDSLLTQRSDNEHESSRRIKTEFLVQLDGATTSTEDRVLVVGATNRPQELDEAARRRLVKKLFIPLPEKSARTKIIRNLLHKHENSITTEQAEDISEKTEGYSGADMTNLCREAALGPIRSVNFDEIESIQPHQVRPINYQDFIQALRCVKASVSDGDMEEYTKWNKKFGSEA